MEGKTLHCFVRSEPGKGIVRSPRNGRSDYDVGVALGPMRVSPSGLTKKQHKKSDVID